MHPRLRVHMVQPTWQLWVKLTRAAALNACCLALNVKTVNGVTAKLFISDFDIKKLYFIMSVIKKGDLTDTEKELLVVIAAGNS